MQERCRGVRAVEALAVEPLEALEPRLLLASGPVISELMADNQSTLADQFANYSDWIEIQNPTTSPVDLEGWYLTDDAANPTQWSFPAVTIDAGGFLVVFASGKDLTNPPDALHTSFRLAAGGEYLALIRPDGVTVQSAYPLFPPQEADVSYGLSQDLSAEGYFTLPTPGTPNASEPVEDPARQIVISEIMYHPSSENDLEEYIELFNRGAGPVPLAGWRIASGADFTFPDVTIGAGAYLVVAADAATFQAKYPGVTNVVGGWSGHLSNKGEQVDLEDAGGVRIDRVEYADEGDWGVRELGPLDRGHQGWIWTAQHDGGGKSLELINPQLGNQYGQNWSASVPDQGTPGTANSVAAADIAPIIRGVSHFPAIPSSADPVTVTARVIDETGTGLTVTVYYRVDGAGSFTTLTMLDDGLHGDGEAGDGTYGAALPAQLHGTIVEFYVQARDGGGKTRTWPAPTQPANQQLANLLYQVDDSFAPDAPWVPGNQPVCYMIMTEAQRAELADIGAQSNGEEDSDALMNGTFISVDGTETLVRYNVGIRNRGHGSRSGPPNNYHVSFAHDDSWNGVTGLNLNCRYTHAQTLGGAIYNMAGLVAPNTMPVQLRINGENLAYSGSPMYGSYVALEAFDGDFANSHFPGDGAGNLYAAFRTDDSPYKEADLRYEGPDPNEYRRTYFKNSNDELDDWSDLIHMTDVLNNAPEATYLQDVSQVINVRQWLRYLALDTLLMNYETGLNRGIGDDYFLYRGIEDPRFVLVPHDLDTVLGQGNSSGDINQSIFQSASVAGLNRFLNHPDIVPLYYATFVELIETFYNPQVLNPLIDQVLGGFAPQANIAAMKQYAANRAAAVLAQIPREFTVQSALPVVGGYPRTTEPQAVLAGTADAAYTRSVLVNGVPADWDPLTGQWAIGQSGGGGGATVLSFRQGVSPTGYAGTSDTELREGDPTANFGSGTSVNVDADYSGGYDAQALLRFDDIFGTGAGQIAPGADIAGATLVLNVTNTGNNLGLYRMLQSWNQATASWSTFGGNGIQANGVEAASQADATATVSSTGTVSINVTASLLAWQANPAGNYGWAILPSGTDGVDFGASENASSTSRPMLTVTLNDGSGGEGGAALTPGINRVVVEAYDGPNGTGNLLERDHIDIWRDSPGGGEAVPGAKDQLQVVVRDSYLPGVPFVVRAEVVDENGKVDRELWDATVRLSVTGNPGITLSTDQITLYNGLGSALVTATGTGDFALTAHLGGLEVGRTIVSLQGAAMTTVSGTLPGTQTTWSGVVHVTGNVLVPDGHTLTVEPGTLVLIDGVPSGTGGTGITVAGTIQSLGTAERPVTFTAYAAGQNWGEIFHDGAEPSLYQYTDITQGGHSTPREHSNTGPTIRTAGGSSIVFDHANLTDEAGKVMYAVGGGDLTFRGVHMARSVMGPELRPDHLLIEDTWITDMHYVDDADGIYIHDTSSGTALMVGGVTAFTDDDGIDTLSAHLTVRDWIIRDANDKGVSVYDGEVTLESCLIVNNGKSPEDGIAASISSKGYTGVPVTVNMDHVTIVATPQSGPDVDVGVYGWDKYGVANVPTVYHITNSIIVATNPVRTDYDPADIHVDYTNLLSQTWAGTGNIASDPLLGDPDGHLYRLTYGSPAIDAGDPTSELDADGTRADMGYHTGGILAPRTLPATISRDMMLVPQLGAYEASGDVTVAAGATLTILPGTTVFFDAGAGLTVNGRLVAEGTEDDLIRLTRVPGAGEWDGIGFAGTMADNRITYAVVEYSTQVTGMVALDNSNLLVDHVTFDHADRRRIRSNNSSLIVRNSVFTDLPSSGVPNNVAEHIWGGGVPAGGHFIIENNVFGLTPGHNDAIDVDAGSRAAGNPVPQILGNTFLGGGDDALDLEGDFHVEGNVFTHYRKDAANAAVDGGESNAISAGDAHGVGHEYVVVRNVFFDCDHVAMVKDASFMTFVNNTVVGVDQGPYANVPGAFNFDLPGQTVGPGRGARLDGNVFDDTPVPFHNVDSAGSDTDLTVDRSVVTADALGLGTGNTTEGARLADPAGGDFGLLPGSPALGTGPNGLDMGAMVPGGASVSGEPTALTKLTGATLTVAGPGLAAYRYRLNDGPWSAERDVATPIDLAGLANGTYTVFVIGKSSAGAWQGEADATASETWTVDTALWRLRINEVLADNRSAVEFGGTFPDLIELYNDGASLVDLSGMSISDSLADALKFVFPAGTTLGAGEYLVLYADDNTTASGLHVGFSLDAEGDEVYLFAAPAAGGALLDSVEFGLQARDLSIGRVGHDRQWALTQPTFGGTNVAQRTGNPAALRINEWLASGQVLFADDFIELYNPDPLPVALAGLFLTDSPSVKPGMSEVAGLSFAAGGGYAVFAADGNSGAGHADFRLSAQQQIIALCDSGLSEIDKVLYYPQTTDVSQGRSPDGSGSYDFYSLPTPGVSNPATAVVTLVAQGATWKYLDNGSNQGTAWREPGFNDASWASGAAQLGYGDGDEATVVGYGGDANSKYITTYFRRTFTVADASAVASLTVFLLRDDGGVVYINGHGAARSNMPDGAIGYQTAASTNVGGADESAFWQLAADPAFLTDGENTIAVEIHQSSGTSADISFDLRLEATLTDATSALSILGALRVTELMYHPLDDSDVEFIELQNVGSGVLDLAGVRLADAVTFVFPQMVLGPGQYVVVVRDRAAFEARYGTSRNVAGEYTGNLSNGSDRVVVKLAWPLEAAAMRFEYKDSWYPTTDGGGRSLVIRDAQAAAATWSDAPSWQEGTLQGGSPGGADGQAIGDVVINEVLTHTDPPQSDTIELYNTTGDSIDIGGWYLTDSSDNYLKFRIPDGTILPGHGYAFYDEDDFNASLGADPNDFALNGAHGDDVWLVAADASGSITRFVDHVSFIAAANGESFGRWPNGSGALFPMSGFTAGQANSAPRVGPLVLSEVHYNPGVFPGADDLEFIEVHNPTGEAVDLTGWRIREGVEYEFAAGSSIPAGGTLVVVSFDPDDPANAVRLAGFRAAYGQWLTPVGGYRGQLSDTGEKVQLQRPDDPPAEEPQYTPHMLEDEVLYDESAPWPAGAAGTGQSLQRSAADLWGNDAASWASAAPTPGSVPWGEITPIANDDTYDTVEDQTLVIATPGVLANDGDPRGGGLSAQWVSGPQHGTLTLNADGSFTYEPDTGFQGEDTFVYRADDGQELSAPATVTISVVQVSDPPTANGNSYDVDEDQTLVIATPGVLANDVDPRGGGLSAQWVSGPQHGLLTLNADGSFTYQPAGNFHGQDTFVYRADDGHKLSAPATVTITVASVNDLPTADAGDDQLNFDTDGDWFETVTLDGSGSSDVEGLASYVWTEGGEQIATGASPSVSLPAGTHTILLTVTDTDGATDVDQVEVTVAPVLGDKPLALISPVTATQVAGGQVYQVQWYGGDAETAVGMMTLGPGGWVMLAEGIPGTAGHYDWAVNGDTPGWYALTAKIQRNGDTTYSHSPASVSVQPGDPPPAPMAAATGTPGESLAIVWLSPAPGAQASRGESFELRWEVLPPPGENIRASLWARPEAHDQWERIADDLDAAEGSYLWDTADTTPGQYSFRIRLGEDDAAMDLAASDWLAVL